MSNANGSVGASASGPLLAGVEAGGTKFICAIADAEGGVLRQVRIETRGPTETMAEVAAFYAAARRAFGAPAAAGVASFGPLDLVAASPAYGSITTTPKQGWSGVNIKREVEAATGAPVSIDTDVTCAALAEGRHGAAQGLSTFCYMTVGTGIGVGVAQGGAPMAGYTHLEAGHMRLPRAPGDENFPGICPYHGDCAEGLASGPAIKARVGVASVELPDDHPVWDMEAFYVATICNNLVYTLRPERIVIGGGVFQRAMLYDRVRAALETQLAGYALSAWERDLESFISPPGLVDNPPGLVGALVLARRALQA